MSIEDIKRVWGDEYPAAVTLNGIRMPLSRETRYARHYYNAEKRQGAGISKFSDGSASISLDELKSEWPKWDDAQRNDLAWNIGYLNNNSDLPEILRFLMRSEDSDHWSAVASTVSYRLPQPEAFELLRSALAHAPAGRSANITQGISLTKHPQAMPLLRKHLADLIVSKDFPNDDPFNNFVAYDAICCVSHLIDLGASPAEFEESVRILANHRCAGTRKSCRDHLKKYFDWL